MYMYSRFTLLYSRNKHNIVKQLYSIKMLKKKKEKNRKKKKRKCACI